MAEKLSDEQLVGLVNQEFDNALGKPNGEISCERGRALDYYLQKPVDVLADVLEGQSKVVTSDVADVVDGIMPSLLRIFTMADNLVNFDPVGQEDVPLAEQESDYVNYVFFKQNPAFLLLFAWFFDALVQKVGIVKSFWDKRERVTQETYKGLTDAELVELLNDEELEPIERDERQADALDEQIGQIAKATVHDVTFRRVSKSGRVCVENVPPEEYRISNDAKSLDPSSARMVGQERLVARSELLEMGFNKEIVDELPAEIDSLNSAEKIARKDKTDDQTLAKNSDRSQDLILLRECYLKVDHDGDGRSELMQIFVAGDRLLEKSSADRQIYHTLCPNPLPHKHFGRSTAEKVLDVQQVNSTLVRQILTNLYHSNNPGHAVWEQGMGENTMDDLLTTRAGGIKRFARPVSESWQPITIPYTAGQTFPMLEYFDKVKRDRTGISSDSQGLSPDALKNIQTTVLAQAADLSRMKIEAIARIFAETGIKSMFLHIHELVLKHQQKAQVVRLRNKFVPVDPRSWRTRFDMTVNVGLGIGTRESNLLHLNAIFEKQAAIVQAGGFGTLVTPMNVYNACAEIVKNANLKSPEMFFTPTNQVQPPSDERAQLERQQMELQARQQQLDAERQAIAAAKLQLQAQKDQLDAQKMIADHRLEVAQHRLKQEEREDRLFVEIEKIRNDLTKMEIDSKRDIPGSRV